MFRKILIIAMFATAAGYCFASDAPIQSTTSEVFYTQSRDVVENTEYVDNVQDYYVEVPVWPIAGSDADVMVSCDNGSPTSNCFKRQDDNIKIVSKIGADLVVENNFNLGGRGDLMGWSGGANMLHGTQAPMGFDDECNSGAEMPLMHREMLEDDGGTILSVSRSNRSKCGDKRFAESSYAAMMAAQSEEAVASTNEIGVDQSADAEAPIQMQDQVRSWVVASGQTLREVLQNWCDKEGWDLVWATPREYPIEASAVFKGRFVDVSSALVRNFGRATPVPYAKFYKGNRVLVVSTTEE